MYRMAVHLNALITLRRRCQIMGEFESVLFIVLRAIVILISCIVIFFSSSHRPNSDDFINTETESLASSKPGIKNLPYVILVLRIRGELQ